MSATELRAKQHQLLIDAEQVRSEITDETPAERIAELEASQQNAGQQEVEKLSALMQGLEIPPTAISISAVKSSDVRFI